MTVPSLHTEAEWEGQVVAQGGPASTPHVLQKPGLALPVVPLQPAPAGVLFWRRRPCFLYFGVTQPKVTTLQRPRSPQQCPSRLRGTCGASLLPSLLLASLLCLAPQFPLHPRPSSAAEDASVNVPMETFLPGGPHPPRCPQTVPGKQLQTGSGTRHWPLDSVPVSLAPGPTRGQLVSSPEFIQGSPSPQELRM